MKRLMQIIVKWFLIRKRRRLPGAVDIQTMLTYIVPSVVYWTHRTFCAIFDDLIYCWVSLRLMELSTK